jgi:hypothetical protein
MEDTMSDKTGPQPPQNPNPDDYDEGWDDCLEEVFRVIGERFPRRVQEPSVVQASQLPAGMEHCTIQFKECEQGHGRLTATNWVDHGCPYCEIAALQLKAAKNSSP